MKSQKELKQIAKKARLSLVGKSTVGSYTRKLLVHRHEYGYSTAFCLAKDFKDKDLLLNEKQAIKLANICGLDFEPDKGEELTILDVPNENDIPTITRDMLK
jgi:hypothetical protein